MKTKISVTCGLKALVNVRLRENLDVSMTLYGG